MAFSAFVNLYRNLYRMSIKFVHNVSGMIEEVKTNIFFYVTKL